MRKGSKTEHLRSKAYEEIKTRILFNDYKPGEKIFESDLVESLKISRTPVREALLILEKDKLVEFDDRLGFIVRRLRPEEIDEYFNIRELLEFYAVPLILDQITPDEIHALEKNISEAESCLNEKDLRSIIRYNIEFHEIMWKSSKSNLYFQIITGLSNMFLWYRAIAFIDPEEVENSINEHKELLSAIKAKDLEKLKKGIKRHLKNARKGNKALHALLI
jgi:DNA-binding GntR family transcriptional regulator